MGDPMLHAMIMAGGGGTRFWPRSRQRRPKQFLTLSGERSLLQLALDRVEALAPPERTWVITGEAYVAETRRQLPSLPADRRVGKPLAAVAERCVASGEHSWNSGIFVWQAATVLAERRRQRPLLYEAVQRVADAWPTPRRADVLRAEYPTMEKVSIDFAVMEHAAEVLVVQAPYRWDDVRSWLALERLNAQDAHHNTVQAIHAGIHTTGCVIVGDDGRLIATIGVKDLLVVQDGDATLIADRKDEATVKQMVDLLKQKGLDRYL